MVGEPPHCRRASRVSFGADVEAARSRSMVIAEPPPLRREQGAGAADPGGLEAARAGTARATRQAATAVAIATVTVIVEERPRPRPVIVVVRSGAASRV